MRLALCLEYPLHQHGGVEALVCALIEALAAEHEILLVSNDDTDAILASTHGTLIRGHFRWEPTDGGEEQVLRLIKWAGEQKVGLFHFHMGGTYAWNARSWRRCAITRCAKAGFPCLTTNHQALSPFDSSHDQRSLWKRLLSFILRWPGKARQLSAVYAEIHVSDHDLRTDRELFPFHRNKLSRIYHSKMPEGDIPTENHAARKPVILNLATIAFRKGQHVLTEAFGRISRDFPGWRLLLVGYHAESACVEEILRIARYYRFEDRIELPGSTSETSRLLNEAGIYVQPSLLEGLGLSLQEAMLHGCACIGSDTGGIPELLDSPSTGSLFPPGDASHLAGLLGEYIRNEELRRTTGESARNSVISRGMTRSAMAAAYQEIYRIANTLACPKSMRRTCPLNQVS